MSAAHTNVSLPEGVSLQRVAQVLLDAWEVGSHQWEDGPLRLRDGNAVPPPPIPRDALDLFRGLHEQRIPYLLVGGIAMLTYVQGRNTKDLELLMSAVAMQQVTELEILSQNDWFVRGQFRSVQVDLLLTTNPLFKTVEERYATKHRFAELEVPAATVEGLIVLKLYALPSLYRQMEMDRIALYKMTSPCSWSGTRRRLSRCLRSWNHTLNQAMLRNCGRSSPNVPNEQGSCANELASEPEPLLALSAECILRSRVLGRPSGFKLLSPISHLCPEHAIENYFLGFPEQGHRHCQRD